MTYEWMAGGFFLLQHVDFDHADNPIKGIEVIGHLRLFGEEPSRDIKSRFYSSTGDTLDYVYELAGNILMIWGGERDSPAYYKGRLAPTATLVQAHGSFPVGAAIPAI